MKGLKSLFTVPEGVKITDKMLTRVLVANICSILLCMSCLVSTTWAWYTVSIENSGNTIEVGTFNPNVTVSNPEGAAVLSNHEIDHRYEFNAPGEYQITLNFNDSTANGFCWINLSDGTDTVSYRTPLISAEGDFSVKLLISQQIEYVQPQGSKDPENPENPENPDPNAATPAAEEGTGEEEQTQPQLPEPTAITMEIIPMWGEPSSTGVTILDNGGTVNGPVLTKYEVAAETPEDNGTDATDPSETTTPTEPTETTEPEETTEPSTGSGENPGESTGDGAGEEGAEDGSGAENGGDNDPSTDNEPDDTTDPSTGSEENSGEGTGDGAGEEGTEDGSGAENGGNDDPSTDDSASEPEA